MEHVPDEAFEVPMLPASEWSPCAMPTTEEEIASYRRFNLYRASDGADVKIDHYEGMDGTPATALALRGNAELAAERAERGFSCEVGLNHAYNIISASVGGQVVGVIVWHEQKTSHRLWLLLGYVLPELRGKGIYNHLWKALVVKAQELKHPWIDSGTRLDNDTMRAVAKAQGRVEESVTLSYKVPAA